MFAHDAPRLAAIVDWEVDWEMASLGDPLLDRAWILTAWREKDDPPGNDPQFQPWDGMPGRAELVGHYAESTGRDAPPSVGTRSWPAPASLPSWRAATQARSLGR